ncbi:MAG: peptidase E [Anaerolineales bacterium]|nr:peptidase E [Anaerolineales bacterium]
MQQIIAVGSGYKAIGRRGMQLERYLLAASRARRPRLCFLPTAAGDLPQHIKRVTRVFSELGARVSTLTLIQPNTADVAKLLLAQDIIWVGGGNTRNMLALWRAWGVDAALHKAYNNGAVLAGGSAGAICWFEQGITDSVPGKLLPMDCLGWLPGSCCPHYDTEPGRRPTFRKLVAAGKVKAGLTLDDLAGAHYINGKLHKVLAFGRGAQAHWVQRKRGRAHETLLGPSL